LIVGISVDQVFGPIVLFGQGGTAVEQVADTAIALPPLNLNLANRLIRRTRAFNLLKGYRDRPAADLGSIALTLVKVAQMAADLADLVELDINPLLAGAQGAIALDARIRVSKASLAPAERLAIRPYPKELEQEGVLADGERIGIRPVRPEDEPAFHAAFQHVSAKDIRMRFFTPLKHLTHAMAARLTQIDYDREMALVAVRRTPGATPGVADIVGVVRLAADPDNAKAEYAVLVRTDFQGRGLGRLLMERLLAVARQRGIGELFGEVLAENVRMLDLARRFGFAAERLAEDSAIVCTRLRLAPRT
jgi:acetyltransferase